MKKHKINLTFETFTLQQPAVTSIIRKCVEATLQAEGITVPCEINVLVTNDKGIHAINDVPIGGREPAGRLGQLHRPGNRSLPIGRYGNLVGADSGTG